MQNPEHAHQGWSKASEGCWIPVPCFPYPNSQRANPILMLQSFQCAFPIHRAQARCLSPMSRISLKPQLKSWSSAMVLHWGDCPLQQVSYLKLIPGDTPNVDLCRAVAPCLWRGQFRGMISQRIEDDTVPPKRELQSLKQRLFLSVDNFYSDQSWACQNQ